MIKRITKNALLLAILFISGFIFVPIGADIKLTLQLLVIFLIFIITQKLSDKLIITICYALLSLFKMGSTYGFIIGFVLGAILFHFIYKINIKNEILKLILSLLLTLIIIYIPGTIFMMIYLNTSLLNALYIGVVPYILIDLIKIGLTILIVITNKKLFNI